MSDCLVDIDYGRVRMRFNIPKPFEQHAKLPIMKNYTSQTVGSENNSSTASSLICSSLAAFFVICNKFMIIQCSLRA